MRLNDEFVATAIVLGLAILPAIPMPWVLTSRRVERRRRQQRQSALRRPDTRCVRWMEAFVVLQSIAVASSRWRCKPSPNTFR